MTWLFVSEAFRDDVRGRAVAALSFLNWTLNLAVSISFLSLIGWRGGGRIVNSPFVYLAFFVRNLLACQMHACYLCCHCPPPHPLTEWLSLPGTFAAYAGVCALSVVFVYGAHMLVWGGG